MAFKTFPLSPVRMTSPLPSLTFFSCLTNHIRWFSSGPFLQGPCLDVPRTAGLSALLRVLLHSTGHTTLKSMLCSHLTSPPHLPPQAGKCFQHWGQCQAPSRGLGNDRAEQSAAGNIQAHHLIFQFRKLRLREVIQPPRVTQQGSVESESEPRSS